MSLDDGNNGNDPDRIRSHQDVDKDGGDTSNKKVKTVYQKTVMANTTTTETTTTTAATTTSTEASTAIHLLRYDKPHLSIIMHALCQENKLLRNILYQLAFLDQDDKVLWTIHDFRRDGFAQMLQETDRDVPYHEPSPGGFFWRSNVWTIPIPPNSARPFILSGGRIGHDHPKLYQIQMGMHRWKVKPGCDKCFTYEYDLPTDTMDLTIPVVNARHDTYDEETNPYHPKHGNDLLGEDGMYLQGTWYCTHPRLVRAFHTVHYERYDYLRLGGIGEDGIWLPGHNDTLQVHHIHLSISGSVQQLLHLSGHYTVEDPPLLPESAHENT